MADRTLADEINESEKPDSAPRRFLARIRAFLDTWPRLRFLYRMSVAVVGTTTILVGIVLLVIPGPGWLMIFLGLGILGMEFPLARRLSDRLKRIVIGAWNWWRKRRAKPSHQADGPNPI
jgi:uncharacterized protein (TIGR02611 family)